MRKRIPNLHYGKQRKVDNRKNGRYMDIVKNTKANSHFELAGV
jgi:hypothetical protein